MATIDCSIIIPTYNTREVTLRCLRTLYANPPQMTFETIVIDNHSTDATAEAVEKEFSNVRVLRNSANLGFSKACNRGAKQATGHFFCFLNSDTVDAGPGLDRLLEWFAHHPRTGIIGPELRSPDGQLIQMSWVWNPILAGELVQQYLAPYSLRQSAFKRRCVAWLQRKSRHVSIICGASLMMRREAYDQIQGFDENFELYFEDSDLCYRCGNIGWDIDFVAEAKITHHLGKSTIGGWSVTSLIYQQSHLAYYRKHAPVWAVWLLKVYLTLKWLRLRYVAFKEKNGRDKSIPYCQAYWKMITEREKATLEQGIPK